MEIVSRAARLQDYIQACLTSSVVFIICLSHIVTAYIQIDFTLYVIHKPFTLLIRK